MTENFLGIPISGDIMSNGPRQEQWGEDKFSELFLPLLLNLDIEEIRWTQYTPYFMDGDVCEFSINSPEIKPRGYKGSDDGYISEYDLVCGEPGKRPCDDPIVKKLLGVSALPAQKPEWEQYGGSGVDDSNATDTYKAWIGYCHSLGHFEDLLMEKFGDHAIVTVTRTSITVDTYEHD